MGTLANSEDPDEMQHNAAFHLGLHYLLGLKQPSGTEINHDLENFTCDPLKYTMGSPILLESICMGKSTSIQMANHNNPYPNNIFMSAAYIQGQFRLIVYFIMEVI